MLQQEGHDVETTADEKLTGRSDVEAAAAAKAEGRILTLDLEFADLRKYPPGSHPSFCLDLVMGPLTNVYLCNLSKKQI